MRRPREPARAQVPDGRTRRGGRCRHGRHTLCGGPFDEPLDVGREQFLVRGLGLLKSTEDIGEIVLKAEDGVPVYLRDVARVVEAPAPRFGAVTRDGEEVVLGMALARIGENAKDVVEAVKGKLDVVRDALPEGIVLKPVYDRSVHGISPEVGAVIWSARRSARLCGR